MNIRRTLNDLLAQRSDLLDTARQALERGDQPAYDQAMAQVTGMNDRIDQLQTILHEEARFAGGAPVGGGESRDMTALAEQLSSKAGVKFTAAECMQAMGLRPRRNAATIDSGAIVAPVGAGSTIRDDHLRTSSLIDQVYSDDYTGLSGLEEPYAVSDPEAQGGDPDALSGTERTASDATFAKAPLRPYEVSVTSFVDSNLRRRNPVKYAEKVRVMAMRALRRKINYLIVNGDGAANPIFFGILNAKNSKGEDITKTISLGASIDGSTLSELVFEYGGDEEVGGNARLILNKANLKAFGDLVDSDGENIYSVIPADGNPNTGTITKGGVVVPYTINSSIGSTKLAYGDPTNFELVMFGDYTVRVDESYKAAERLDTILGDALVGGNLIVHQGFVVGTLG